MSTIMKDEIHPNTQTITEKIRQGMQHPEYETRTVADRLFTQVSVLLVNPEPVPCPLMKHFKIITSNPSEQSCLRNCDNALAHRYLPVELRTHDRCAAGGECVLRKLPNIEGKSIMSVTKLCQAYNIPFPYKEFSIAVAQYCESKKIRFSIRSTHWFILTQYYKGVSFIRRFLHE